jgi:hypothetical protein
VGSVWCSYKNGSIREVVTFSRENLDYDRPLQAGISMDRRGAVGPRRLRLIPTANSLIDGLAAGEYEISILSETKTIVVDNDSESRISFVIDRNARE